MISFPEVCPFDVQGEVKLIQAEGEAAWRCPHCTCGRQSLQKMIFHVSKDAMDIDGFGKSYVERFYELGWVKDMSDIYNLDYNAISQLEGFGAKSSDKLKKSIGIAKSNPLSRLLYSLCIHHFGKKASKLIAQEITDVYQLANWSEEDFLSIKDIGPVVAKNVISYFSKEENIDMIKRMEAHGVNVRQTEEDKPIEVAQDLSLIHI